MTTPQANSNQPARARSRTRRAASTVQPTSVSDVPPTMPVDLAAFLDLVAELIAGTIWQGTSGSTAPAESLALQPDGHSALRSSEAGNGGPIPSFPADSHPHSHSSPTTSRRATRRAPPKEAS